MTSLQQAMQKHRLPFLLQFSIVKFKEESLEAIHTHDNNILGHNPCAGIGVLIG